MVGQLRSFLGRLTTKAETREEKLRGALRSMKTEQPVLSRCMGGEKQLHEDYEMLGFLGRGGFGTVRRARERTTGLIRAIKTVPCGGEDGKGPTPERWEKLFIEVEALMGLVHPNIVRLHGYYQSADTLYLVEEFCSGGTLEQRLKAAGGRFSAAEAAVVMRHMLRSVLCCHAHGLSHRDLKLDNFVYAFKGESAALKLIDFGLSVSRPLGQGDDGVDELPRSYVQAGGTLEHSAPETLPKRDETGRLTKEACYAPPADIWSLGSILFHMLTGEPRLPSPTALALLGMRDPPAITKRRLPPPTHTSRPPARCPAAPKTGSRSAALPPPPLRPETVSPG